MQINSIKNEKNILRRDILKRRNEINDKDKKDRNFKILNILTQLKEVKDSDCFCTYVSKINEVDTTFLIEHLLVMNKNVYVPKSEPNSSIMKFYKINFLSELSLGAFSVLEPNSLQEEYIEYGKYDVCIVPALSFDKRGFRLGYGKGYYDRFLKDFKGIKIGLCYEEFVTEILPKYETDIAVDMIITENETILCKGGK